MAAVHSRPESDSQFQSPNTESNDLHPVKSDRATLSKWDIASLWIGMVIGIPNYYVAGTLVDVGMSWYQGILTVIASQLILLLPLILTAQPGTYYRISFPILARSSFGIRGSHVPCLLRSLIACGWFGIETWIGGQAISLLLPTSIRNKPTFFTESIPWLGTSLFDFSCFIFFWVAQMAIIWKGMNGIRILERYSCPLLIILTLSLLCWAYIQAGGFGDILSLPSSLTPSQFWVLFFPSLTATIGSWSTIAINIPDFSRFAKTQKDQIIGQLGLPIYMGAFAFVGLAVTSSTQVIFGHSISNPLLLLEQIGGGIAVTLVAVFGISLATVTTNIPANIVAPANALVNFCPSKFNFFRGALLTAVVGIAFQPWRIIGSSETFVYTWLVGYAAFLGPIGGIVLVDYYLIKRMVLDFDSLYSSSPFGRYYYWRGYNLVAMVALIVGIVPVIPGFLHKVGILKTAWGVFVGIYDNSWFFGTFSAGIVYWILSWMSSCKQAAQSVEPLMPTSA